MIWAPFILAFGAALSGILALLSNAPDVADVPLFSNAIATVEGLWAGLQAIFPFTALWACIGIDLAFEISYFAYKGIRWAYRKIPGVS